MCQIQPFWALQLLCKLLKSLLKSNIRSKPAPSYLTLKYCWFDMNRNENLWSLKPPHWNGKPCPAPASSFTFGAAAAGCGYFTNLPFCHRKPTTVSVKDWQFLRTFSKVKSQKVLFSLGQGSGKLLLRAVPTVVSSFHLLKFVFPFRFEVCQIPKLE